MEICSGCGSKLQIEDESLPGYIPKIKEDKVQIVCMRCHNIKHQNKLLSHIPNFAPNDIKVPSKSLVLVVFDVLNYPNAFQLPSNVDKSNILLVGTKIDLLPKHTNLIYLHSLIKKDNPEVAGLQLLSSKSSAGVSELINTCKKLLHKNNLINLALTGYVNSGKTSLMNRLLFMSKMTPRQDRKGIHLTDSCYPGTTVDNISFPIRKMKIFGDLIFGKLIDTPGIHDSTSNYNLLSSAEISKYNLKTKFKPRSFVIPRYYQKSIFIGGLARLDLLNITEDPVKMVWFGPNLLNPHFCNFDNANVFWNSYKSQGMVNYGPPYTPPPSEMEFIKDIELKGSTNQSLVEIVVKNMGWFNILKASGSATLKLHSVVPNSCFSRPPMLKIQDPRGLKSPLRKFFGNHTLKLNKYIKI